jgi:hypothetical protein
MKPQTPHGRGGFQSNAAGQAAVYRLATSGVVPVGCPVAMRALQPWDEAAEDSAHRHHRPMLAQVLTVPALATERRPGCPPSRPAPPVLGRASRVVVVEVVA